jgi:hypothetical protein
VGSWLRKHWRPVVASTAIVSLVAGAGVWTLVQRESEISAIRARGQNL